MSTLIVAFWTRTSFLPHFPSVLNQLICDFSKSLFFGSKILTNELENKLLPKLLKQLQISENIISFNLLYQQTRDIKSPKNKKNPKKLKSKKQNAFSLFNQSKIEIEYSKIFHKLCDNKGSTITLIQTEYNHIIGGYTSKSFKSPKLFEYIIDSKQFLFLLKFGESKKLKNENNLNLEKLENDLPIIFELKNNELNYPNICQHSKEGPSFGRGDLHIYFGQNKNCFTSNKGSFIKFQDLYNCEPCFEALIGYNTYRNMFVLKECEVFQICND